VDVSCGSILTACFSEETLTFYELAVEMFGELKEVIVRGIKIDKEYKLALETKRALKG